MNGNLQFGLPASTDRQFGSWLKYGEEAPTFKDMLEHMLSTLPETALLAPAADIQLSWVDKSPVPDYRNGFFSWKIVYRTTKVESSPTEEGTGQ